MRGDYKLFEKVDKSLIYSEKEITTINKLLSSSLTHAEIWGGKLTNTGITWKERGDIINKIKRELGVIQDGYCYFCGFKFGYKVGLKGNLNIHREHFAPKSLYREFTFTAENLILA